MLIKTWRVALFIVFNEGILVTLHPGPPAEDRCLNPQTSPEVVRLLGVPNSHLLTSYDQWIFQVPVKGGRYYIITQLAVYTTYIPLIYCLLGDYIIPTTFYGNQKQPLI